MLEKMAEMVREDALIAGAEYDDESRMIELELYLKVASPVTINADIANPVSAESKVARWAVLLVARALEKWVSEIDRTNGVDLGDVEALGSEFMDLYYEVKKAEAKEAEHEWTN